MNKKGIKKLFAMTIVFCSVFALALSFATVSDRIGYSKTSSNHSKRWEVVFENLSDPQVVGGAKVVGEPALVATNISSYSVVLTKPGDSVTYTFDVANKGNINAELKNYTKLNAVCNSGIVDTASATVVCGNLTYTLSYTGGLEVKEGDTLKAKETKNLTLTIAYNKNAKELPTSSVTIRNLDITMLYTQAN